MELDPEEIRVLACLAEKQLTTPVQYPLTLNALTLACNQTSSREPVVDYDEQTVEAAVRRAKTKGLARFVHPSHGRSALRFGHTLDEALALEVPALAVLTVLMLRGPQTSGELRVRTARMADFATPRDVEEELERLSSREPPLVIRLGRQPGQKEERYRHLLGGTVPAAGAAASPMPIGDTASPPAERVAEPVGAGPVAAPSPVTDSLAGEVADLRAEVMSLRRDVDDLRTQLGL